MFRPRLIPCLLLKDAGLVKTVNFKNPTYIGDPINTVHIFNEKGVDELIFLDIAATVQKRLPRFDIIEKIATECFMPICCGGGIRSIQTVRKMLRIGIEKVSISGYAVENPDFIKEVSREFGSQSTVVCIDVRKNRMNRYEVVIHNGRKRTGIDPLEFAINMEKMGAGELLINSVDRDGMMDGYDVGLIHAVTQRVNIPVIACGGAGKLDHIRDIILKGGASSAAAGSLFVFCGKLRAVLINYPEQKELETFF
jgi:cyclase